VSYTCMCMSGTSACQHIDLFAAAAAARLSSYPFRRLRSSMMAPTSHCSLGGQQQGVGSSSRAKKFGEGVPQLSYGAQGRPCQSGGRLKPYLGGANSTTTRALRQDDNLTMLLSCARLSFACLSSFASRSLRRWSCNQRWRRLLQLATTYRVVEWLRNHLLSSNSSSARIT
jgi:hypothetical protein